MRTAGRELVGDKGLNCIACHTFNGKTPSKAGIDLLTTTERLRPDWFYHFMVNPSPFRYTGFETPANAVDSSATVIAPGTW